MELETWQPAFVGLAIAMAVAGVLPYGIAMRHMYICLKIAAMAAAEGRRPLLGVLYDEAARCLPPRTRACVDCIIWQGRMGR